MRAITLPISKFRLNRAITSRVIAKKWFSIWRPSAILNLGISEFFSHFRDLVKPCVRLPNFVIFGWFAAEIWIYNDFQNGGRPPCWIYCDVIILCRKTEFDDLDIVLNFDVHRFDNSFWYISIIMFHNFSLKLPIFALIFTYFWKIWENIKFKCCNPPNISIFVICTWEERNCLIDCLIVCFYEKKTKNSPICQAKMG